MIISDISRHNNRVVYLPLCRKGKLDELNNKAVPLKHALEVVFRWFLWQVNKCTTSIEDVGPKVPESAQPADDSIKYSFFSCDPSCFNKGELVQAQGYRFLCTEQRASDLKLDRIV